ncbi:MAG: 2Fe-2S iron-sulfur cluster-binding protein [Microthrixaceae bacterium]
MSNAQDAGSSAPGLRFTLDGRVVDVADDSGSLLEVLRDRLGVMSVKDGCSPQGQCGCCTVLVDGTPRVSCVTPARRVAGRTIETVDGLAPEVGARWSRAFVEAGASQCGFCTPGIIMRLEGHRRRGDDLSDRRVVGRALAAHLCRCTGWQTIFEAAEDAGTAFSGSRSPASEIDARDLDGAARRATIEGHRHQAVGPEVVLGRGGFADDRAPRDAPVGLRAADGTLVVADTAAGARAAIGKVQGRQSTQRSTPPVPLPEPTEDWVSTLRTSWVDPGYIETDSSWCEPDGDPADPEANGGGFGGKAETPVREQAAAGAALHGRPVRVRWSREDVTRHGAKRPPLSLALRSDGSLRVVVARTPGIGEVVASYARDVGVASVTVTEVDVVGPPTSGSVRAAGWGEVAAFLAATRARRDGTTRCEVTSPEGAWASAECLPTGIEVEVRCGEVLDATVLRSYCIGAAHMALGWVTSESLTVDDEGEVHTLTIRSLGIVRPLDMVPVDVTIHPDGDRGPVCGSDAVFAAVAGSVWAAQGCPPTWPTDVAFSVSG